MVTTRTTAAVVLLSLGCGADDDAPRIGLDTRADEIVRPSGEATTHPYACTIRMGAGGACSGALVARNVVLTASHCVSGASSFTVQCPYAGDTAAATGRESMMSPTGRLSFAGGYIRPESGSDVALIRLDRDVRATRYAPVRLTNVGTGTRAYVIGRINNGTFTNRLWVSPVINLIWRYGPGNPPYALGAATGLTQPGDSGGPTFDADTDEVIGVVSGGSSRSSMYGVVGAHAQWFVDTVTRWSGAPPAGGGAPPTPPTGDPPAAEVLSPADGAALAGDRRIELTVRGRTAAGIASSRVEWINGAQTFSFDCPGSGEAYTCALRDDTATYSVLVSTGVRRYRAAVTDRSGRAAWTPWRTVNLTTGASAPTSPGTPPPPPPTPGAGPAVTDVTPGHGTSLVGNRWTHLEARVAPGAAGVAVDAVELRWSFNDQRFPCPGRSGAYYCTVDGDRYRWSLHVGAGDRVFSVRATDLRGAEAASPAAHLSFSNGPTDCRESSSGGSAIWTCTPDALSRDRCLAGRLERERCARGCLARPPGVDDLCAP
ncbi:MAG: trypsin-like serine protease [Polyangiales bacterium]